MNIFSKILGHCKNVMLILNKPRTFIILSILTIYSTLVTYFIYFVEHENNFLFSISQVTNKQTFSIIVLVLPIWFLSHHHQEVKDGVIMRKKANGYSVSMLFFEKMITIICIGSIGILLYLIILCGVSLLTKVSFFISYQTVIQYFIGIFYVSGIFFLFYLLSNNMMVSIISYFILSVGESLLFHLSKKTFSVNYLPFH